MGLCSLDDLAQLILSGVGRRQFYPDPNRDWTWMNVAVDPEDTSEVGIALHRDFQVAELNVLAGGLHRHDRGVTRGEGCSQEPPGRGSRRAAPDGLGHVAGQMAIGALDSNPEAVLAHGCRRRVGTGGCVRVLP